MKTKAYFLGKKIRKIFQYISAKYFTQHAECYGSEYFYVIDVTGHHDLFFFLFFLDCIGCLVTLQSLDLSYNKLICLSPAVAKLTQLHYLDVGYVFIIKLKYLFTAVAKPITDLFLETVGTSFNGTNSSLQVHLF